MARAQFYTSNLMAGSEQNMTSSVLGLVSLTAATATLTDGEIYAVIFGASGAPNSTDCSLNVYWQKQTTVGTGTSATPIAFDPNKRAAGMVGTVNYTVNPTLTAATQFGWSVNQRQTWDKYLMPFDELIIPNTNVAGWTFLCKSATYASTVDCTVSHRE